MRVFGRKRGIRLAILFGVLLALCAWGWAHMILMPGRSFSGELPPLTSEEKALSAELRRDVEELAATIGIRNAQAHAALSRAADAIERNLREAGLAVARQTFEVEGKPFHNLEAEVRGIAKPGEIVVVGAHYDSVDGSPGANDNASGTAGLLALARRLAGTRPERTLRFVAFTNEEPPFFWTDQMGSTVYAKRCRERRENVVAMLSLETIGFYSDEEGSQKYPPPFGLCYPSKGNFIAIVGNLSCRKLVRRCVGAFREEASFPSEGGALPGFLPGVGWSDHLSFWQEGYDAVMVTDTAPFRYPHYHTYSDTPDKLDYDRCARVVAGVGAVVRRLAGVK